MKEWKIGGISVSTELGHPDDSDIDLVVKAKAIPVGDGSQGGPSIMVHEASKAKNIEYWPVITMEHPKRRNAVFQTALEVLRNAEKSSITSVGFFTMGLEAARIPSWEIAEELVRALNTHSKKASSIQYVSLIASSPTQLSSFQFALNNAQLYSTSY